MNNERNHAIIEVRETGYLNDNRKEFINDCKELFGGRSKHIKDQGEIKMTVEKRYITEEAREEARQRIAKRMEEWKNVRAEQGKHQSLSVKERIAAVRERQSNIFADLDAAMKTLKPFYIDGGGSGAIFIAEVINGLIDCSLVRLHNIHHLDSENFEAVMDVIRAWRTWPGETRTRMIAALYKDGKK